MATVDRTLGTSTGKGLAALYGKHVKTIYALIDLQDVVTEKGSALAAGDVINCLRVPAGSRVLFAGAKVVTATDANTLHFSLGTASEQARYIAAFAGTAQTAGFSTPATPANTYVINSSQTTIDMVIGTYTGTALTAGLVAVFAEIADYSEFAGAQINDTTSGGVAPA